MKLIIFFLFLLVKNEMLTIISLREIHVQLRKRFLARHKTLLQVHTTSKRNIAHSTPRFRLAYPGEVKACIFAVTHFF
jgi:hypothetical protein